ncbi:hypothetical protein Dxin01_01772 [Deinococcus xinjiangensis]|uniref:Uncharacterized protein n=1 Tax=Deinococcus xinjiangensis TaxID=457454 RepID=A0ABP9V9T5_9DEIO
MIILLIRMDRLLLTPAAKYSPEGCLTPLPVWWGRFFLEEACGEKMIVERGKSVGKWERGVWLVACSMWKKMVWDLPFYPSPPAGKGLASGEGMGGRRRGLQRNHVFLPPLTTNPFPLTPYIYTPAGPCPSRSCKILAVMPQMSWPCQG